MNKAVFKYLPALAGILFGVGWFIWIDGHVYENTRNNIDSEFGPRIQWLFYLPGIFATLGLIMANIVDLSALSSSSLLSGEGTATKTRVWLFISFAISFGCIGAALWIMTAVFLPPHNNNTDAQWPGIAITLQTSLIFLSSLLMVFKKSRQDDDFEQF